VEEGYGEKALTRIKMLRNKRAKAALRVTVQAIREAATHEGVIVG
jgi:hypothetical protein